MNMTFRPTLPATDNRIARTFAETAKSYIENGGERKYLDNILPHLGDHLAMGVGVKSIVDAGGWRSAAVFLGTYANPPNAGRIVADRHNLYQFDNAL